MAKNRKKRRVKVYWLFDNSALFTLNDEERKQIDLKKKILYPPILLIENARHGLDRRRAFLNLKNTYNTLHWSERAKWDLLVGPGSDNTRFVTRAPIKSIFEESATDRQVMESKSADIVRLMDKSAYDFKSCPSTFRPRDDELLKLCESLEDISDKEVLRRYNQAQRKFSQIYGRLHNPILPGVPDKKILEIKAFLKRYKDECAVDTLEKADMWAERLLCQIGDPLEFIYELIGYKPILSLTTEEWTTVRSRYIAEGQPDINIFSPYAAAAIRLHLTMSLFLTENAENSISREVFRDLDYLYYALDDNVIFVSADDGHKRLIEEIPLLSGIRERFIFINKKNEVEINKGLSQLGLKSR